MYLGKIVRTYIQGSVIPVTVVVRFYEEKFVFFYLNQFLIYQLTANHRGVFEFRVCNIDDNPNEDATQNCLDLNLLKITNNSTQYHIESTYSTVHINVILPANLTCKHCVFQWKYITGNNWGSSNGRSCVGCGDKNEEFYGCSDIAIRNENETIIDSVTSTIKPIEIPRKCTSTITFSRSFDLTALMIEYCQTICLNNCAIDKGNSNHNDCIKSCDKLCICQ